MKWLAKHTEVNYPHGATRLQRRFAFVPIYISGKMVWLETFEILQMYEEVSYTIKIDGIETIFKVAKWLNVSKRIIE